MKRLISNDTVADSSKLKIMELCQDHILLQSYTMNDIS